MPFHSLGTWGLVLGAVGVLTLVGVVISGLAAPNPLFSIFTLAGLLLCGLGILLMAVQWLRELIRPAQSQLSTGSAAPAGSRSDLAADTAPALIPTPIKKALLP